MCRGNCTFILKSIGFDFWSAVVVWWLFLVPLLSDFSFIFSSQWKSQEVFFASACNLHLSCQMDRQVPLHLLLLCCSITQPKPTETLQATSKALECRPNSKQMGFLSPRGHLRIGTIPWHLGSCHHHQWKSLTEQCPPKEQVQPLPGLLGCKRSFATQESFSK